MWSERLKRFWHHVVGWPIVLLAFLQGLQAIDLRAIFGDALGAKFGAYIALGVLLLELPYLSHKLTKEHDEC